MDSGNFLSPQTLDEIYGGGSLEGVLQGRQQVGLANQFQQQGLTANDLANKKAELANQFTIEDNPLKLENSRLTNTGLENKNTTEGVAARRALANEGMQLSQDQKDFAVKASKADLDQAENHALGILQDPFASRENKDAASKILDFTKAAVEARRANDLAKSLEHVRGNEHMRGVNAQTASAERIATLNRDARTAAKTAGTGRTFLDRLSKEKVKERVGTLNATLAAGINPDTKEPLTDIEKMYFTAMKQQDERTLDAAVQAGGIAPTVENGKIVIANKPTRSVAAPTTAVGQTKSGTKFKVVE